jgi:hypothetical protein
VGVSDIGATFVEVDIQGSLMTDVFSLLAKYLQFVFQSFNFAVKIVI